MAVRGLLRAPRFALTAIVALALGIGPNTAIFSVVYGTLLAPLPFPQPERLVMVWSMEGENRARTSPAEYLDWKAQSRSFEYLEPFWARQFNLATLDAPERIRARQVSADGHRMFGESVWLGRDFRAEDEQPGKDRVVLLTHRLWRERFGADAAIVGRDIRMDGTPYTVIGVLLPGQRDRLPADLWIPLSFTPEERSNRQFRPLLMTGRLKPGVTIERAQAEMDLIAKGLAERFPDSNARRTIRVQPLQNNFLSADVATNLWLLLAAVGFVVLIASVNVANLLLSRGAARAHETALRAALGARPGRLARLAMIESLALAAAGGVLGALSSAWLLQGILAALPPGTLPAEADPRLNLPVLLFTLGAAGLCGLLCGSLQGWQASRMDANDVLKQAGRSSIVSGRRGPHRALVMIEFALAMTLLVGAGLTIVSFWNRMHADLGVRRDGVLTFTLPVDEGRLTTGAETEAFFRQVVEQLEALPDVERASLSAPGLPLGPGFSREFAIAGTTDPDVASRPSAGVQIVTPGFFETFGVRLMRGRVPTSQDGASSQPVAVVNARFVELFLQGREPLGQRVVMNGFVPRGAGLGPGAAAPGPPGEWHLVGVVGNVSNADRFGEPEAPQIYVPFAQSPWPQVTVALRSGTGRPDALRQGAVSAIRAIDPHLPLTQVRTLEQVVGERLAPDRLNIALYGGLAVLALALAAVGIYGVMAYVVTRRVPEIGLRMALGAGRSQVRMQILREGLTLAAGGLGFGLLGAYALGRAMQRTLYGTAALDPVVVGAVAAVLLSAALAACYLPARRASAVDPLVALRQQ